MTARYWSVRTDGLVTYSTVTDADVILLGQPRRGIGLQEAIKTCLMQVRGLVRTMAGHANMGSMFKKRRCRWSGGLLNKNSNASVASHYH